MSHSADDDSTDGGPAQGMRRSRDEITKLIREEAARRRSSEEAVESEEVKSRFPFRTVLVIVASVTILVGLSITTMEALTILRKPSDRPVVPLSLVEISDAVPAVSTRVENKRITIEVGTAWERFPPAERRARFGILCSTLAGRDYQGATLIGSGGRPVATWSQGLIQVE